MKPLAIVIAALATATGTTSPAELLGTEVPAGFDLADGAAADLTFEEYAPLAPQATAHVDGASAEARAMRAAVDVWTSGEDDILLREITLWTTDEAARAFVEQSVVVGTENELDEAEAPFDGGVAFFGADEGLWTRTLTWRQGPYGITISHFAIDEGSDATIDEAAEALAANIESATDHGIASSGVLPETTDPSTSTASGGGIPIGTVFIWLVIIVGGIWLIVKVKKMIATRNGNAKPTGPAGGSAVDPEDPDDVDDLIERARARSRAEREIDAIPDPTVEWDPSNDT
ncbi:MAG: hypothetical protein R8G01_18090 [Ilumatobacteraceae bacterium]|nr:hypothetical protein [Ilumatobacteraceae bacterium]